MPTPHQLTPEGAAALAVSDHDRYVARLHSTRLRVEHTTDQPAWFTALRRRPAAETDDAEEMTGHGVEAAAVVSDVLWTLANLDLAGLVEQAHRADASALRAAHAVELADLRREAAAADAAVVAAATANRETLTKLLANAPAAWLPGARPTGEPLAVTAAAYVRALEATIVTLHGNIGTAMRIADGTLCPTCHAVGYGQRRTTRPGDDLVHPPCGNAWHDGPARAEVGDVARLDCPRCGRSAEECAGMTRGCCDRCSGLDDHPERGD